MPRELLELWLREEYAEQIRALVEVAETPDNLHASQVERAYVRGSLDMLQRIAEQFLVNKTDDSVNVAAAVATAMQDGQSILSP